MQPSDKAPVTGLQKQPARKAPIWLFYFKLFLGLTLLAYLLSQLEAAFLFNAVAKIDKFWFSVALLGGLVAYDFQSFLFGIAASPFARIPHRKILIYTLIGRFFSAFLPSGIGGDVIKGIYLKPYFNNISELITSLMAHRIISGLTGVASAFLAVSLLYSAPTLSLHPNWPLIIGGFVAFICFVICVLCWRKYLPRRIRRLLSIAKLYSRRKAVLIGLGIGSIITHAITVLLCLAVSYSLNMPLTLSQAILTSMVTLVFTYFPLTPGNIGVGETIFVYVATSVGVSRDEAIAIAVLRRLLGYVYAIPGAALYIILLYHNRNVGQRSRESINDSGKTL